MHLNEVCKNNQNSNGFHFIVTSTESSILTCSSKFSLGGEKSLFASLVIRGCGSTPYVGMR